MTYNPFEESFHKNIGEPRVCFLLTKITIDVTLHVRLNRDEETIERYKQKYLDGVEMPPIVLFDDGTTLWLVDGFLRAEAAKRAGLTSLPVEVHQGTRRDALLYACGANDEHGFAMTRADKRRAATILLLDAEWGLWSNCELARRCKCSESFIRVLRAELKQETETPEPNSHIVLNEVNNPTEEPEQTRIYKNRHGTISTMRLQGFQENGHKQDPSPDKELSDEEYKQRTEDNREARLIKIATSAKAAQSKTKPGPFAVLYVDPPWEYEAHASKERDIENQYPTMSLRDLRRLDVASISTKQAILYLWVTSPMIPDALSLIEAWDFRYRTCAVWDKEIAGMGYWFRQQHEQLFVATRGSFPPPKPEARISSVLRVRRGAHSQKPQEVRAALESWYPELPKVELFAREKAEGWASLGNEIDGRDIREVIGLRSY